MPGSIHKLTTFLASSYGMGIFVSFAFIVGDGNIYVAGTLAASTLTTIKKSNGAQLAQVDSQGSAARTIYDPISGQFFITPGGAGFSHWVSRGNGSFVQDATTGGVPFAEAVAQGKWFGGDLNDDNVSFMTTAGSGAAAFGVGAGPGISFPGGQIPYDSSTNLLFVYANNSLISINASTNAIVNTFDLDGHTGGAFARLSCACLHAPGSFLVLGDHINGTLNKVDQATGNVLLSVPYLGGGEPTCIAFDGTYFWISDTAGDIAVYDVNLNFQASAPTSGDGTNFTGCDSSEGAGFAWVTSSNSGSGTGQVERFQFIPAGMSAGFYGTMAGFTGGSGQILGGTK